MIFLTIWIYSFVIAVAMLLIDCYKNPGRMYMDVFILMIYVLAIPGAALFTILASLYNRFLSGRTKAERDVCKEEGWKKIDELHDMLQILKGKF